MQRTVRTILPAVLVILLMVLASSFVSASPMVNIPGSALILSSLESYVPTLYQDSVVQYLAGAGYQVTVLDDAKVTLQVLLTQLDGYDILIWRTNVYNWNHITYWYVGELYNQSEVQRYAADFSSGRADYSEGIIGVSQSFFTSHFGNATLFHHLRLVVLVSSLSDAIAEVLVRSGVRAAVYTWGYASLYYGNVDSVTRTLIQYLTHGKTVQAAVFSTIKLFQPWSNPWGGPVYEGNTPQIWYMGDSTITIS